jgi:hypothetical protein
MIRTFYVAVLGGVFFAVVTHCVAGGLRSDLGDWPALIGCAAGAIVGAVAGAAERIVRAIDAQTARLTGARGNRQHPAGPSAVGRAATGIQAGLPGRASQ